VFKIHERVRRPDLLPDFFAADNFSGMLQQNFQNEIRLAAQIDLRPVLVELAGGGLELERAKTNFGGGQFH